MSYRVLSACAEDLGDQDASMFVLVDRFENEEEAKALAEKLSEEDQEAHEASTGCHLAGCGLHTYFVKQVGKPLYRIYVRSVLDPFLLQDDSKLEFRSLPSATGEVQFWDELLSLEETRRELALTNRKLALESAKLPQGVSLEAFIFPEVTTDKDLPPPRKKAKT